MGSVARPRANGGSAEVGDVVSIESKLPHISCPAKCLSCGHGWHAVAPCGVIELECPECLCMRGVWSRCISPEITWECGCGSRHFFVTLDGPTCAACGVLVDMGEDAGA